MKHVGIVSLVAITSACGIDSGPEQIAIEQQNQLGVVAIELDRAQVDGNRTFEMRGLDASGQVVARVGMRIGEISDLLDHVPGLDRFGSEITMSFTGHEPRRLVSRETEYLAIPPSSDAAVQEFLALPPISDALAHEAGIHVPELRVENAYDYYPYTVQCPASYMLTSPTAVECCWSSNNPWGPSGYTYFATSATTWSYRQGPSTACRAQNGGACNGASCYYGPMGFARAVIDTYPSVGHMRTFGIGSWPYCGVNYPDYTSAEFGNVVGTGSTGQGCPGGGTGAYQWDY